MRYPRIILAIAAASGIAETVHAGPAPRSVSQYVGQFSEQCRRLGRTPAVSSSFLIPADLNGDKLEDWVVNEGGACDQPDGVPAGGVIQITIFAGAEGGEAVPVFQQGAYGVRLERGRNGPQLWLAVAGSECGLTSGSVRGAQCDRPVAWDIRSKVFQLGPLASRRMPSRITQ